VKFSTKGSGARVGQHSFHLEAEIGAQLSGGGELDQISSGIVDHRK